MFKQILAFLLVATVCNVGSNAGEIASHFCCAVDTHKETIETRTKVVSQVTIVTSQYVSNYTYCPPIDHNGIIDHIVSNLTANSSDPHATTKPLPTIKPCISRPIYSLATSQKVTYRIDTYQVPVVTVNCPPEHIICCDGYKKWNKDCIPEELYEQLADLLNGIGK